MPVTVSPRNLLRSVVASDQSLKRARQLRREAIQEYAGRYGFFDDGTERPVNLVQRFIKTMSARLVAREPAWNVTTENPQLRGMSEVLKRMLARAAKRAKIVHHNRMLVRDALFGCRAICRIGLKVGCEAVTMDGREVNLGELYMRRVDLDDWVCDSSARHRDELRWEGERYRVARQTLLDSGIFDNAVVERMTRLPFRHAWQRKVEDLPFGTGLPGRTTERFEFVDDVELLDVVLYDNDQSWKVTLPSDADYSGDFLRIEPYEGPQRGPFEWLEYDQLPAILNGIAPVAQHREQSENVNDVIVKTLEQVGKTKRVLGVQKGVKKEEIRAVEESMDGDTIGMDDPKAYSMLEFGNISSELLPLTGVLMDYWNMQSGNVDILGGTRAKSGTATQFQGLAANAESVADDLVDLTDDFHERQGQHLAWWLLSDPRMVQRESFRLPSGDIVPMVYDATTRQGDFAEFAFTVKPKSTIRQDGAVRAGRFVQLMGLAMQSAQVTLQTGGAWKTGAFLKKAGEIIDIEELDTMYEAPEIMQQAMLEMQLMPQPPGMPQPMPGYPVPNTPNRWAPGGQTARPPSPANIAMAGASLGAPSATAGAGIGTPAMGSAF